MPRAVAQARSTIRPEVIPEIMFGQLQRAYAADRGALRLDVIAGRHREGHPAQERTPAVGADAGLYTKKVFKEITAPAVLPN